MLRHFSQEMPRLISVLTTSSDASMIRLRDIMMSILKDMKEAYDSKLSDTDISQLTEMMSVMFKQAKEISNDRSVTTEDMSDILVNYLAQTGLDEKALKIVKKLCLHLFKGKE